MHRFLVAIRVGKRHALAGMARGRERLRRLTRGSRALVLLFNREAVVNDTRVAVVQSIREGGLMGDGQMRHGDSASLSPVHIQKGSGVGAIVTVESPGCCRMLCALKGTGLVVRGLERLARVPVQSGRKERRGVKVQQLFQSHSHNVLPRYCFENGMSVEKMSLGRRSKRSPEVLFDEG